MGADSQCPNCGTPYTVEGLKGGLCPACLFDLALSPIEGDDVEEVAPRFGARTGEAPAGPLVPGRVLGDRYRIRSLLGRGGLGEVWRGFDLKLRVDVALKATCLRTSGQGGSSRTSRAGTGRPTYGSRASTATR